MQQNTEKANYLTSLFNTREKLSAIADWLFWQDETLSDGLKSVADAEKLYDYAQAHPELPERYDEDADDVDMSEHRIKALGYDPMA